MTLQFDDLVGAWSLRRVTATGEDGQTTQPYGAEPDGLLLYTPDGWMSATITSENRQTVYAGRVAIRDDEVVHSVVVGVPPFGPGAELTRQARLNEPDRLELTAVPSPTNRKTMHLTWQRNASG